MKDLIRLYNIESVHPNEAEMHAWLCAWLDGHEVKYETDGFNIYRLTGNKVVLSAHMDQVETNGQAVHFYKDGNIIRGYNKDYEQTSLGADDKNGVWIILKALEERPDTDFIISYGEEVGCVGINSMKKILDKKLHQDMIALVLDRRGFGEILDKGSSKDYCCTLAQDLCNYWNRVIVEDDLFKVGSGSVSDTNVLCEYCESVNIGVGYYNPHTEKEETDFEELSLVKDLVLNTLDNFVHYPCPVSTYKRSYTYGSYFDSYEKDSQQDLFGRYY